MVFFSFDRFTASHHASLTGSSEVVISLIELESDINARDHKGDKCCGWFNYIVL